MDDGNSGCSRPSRREQREDLEPRVARTLKRLDGANAVMRKYSVKLVRYDGVVVTR